MASHFVLLLLFLTVPEEGSGRKRMFQLLWSSEAESQIRVYPLPSRNTALPPNLPAQNARHTVDVPAYTKSLSSQSILPALFINLMTKGLLIWGQHNTGQQKKKKNESEGQDVPHIPNSAISFERHSNQIAGIFCSLDSEGKQNDLGIYQISSSSKDWSYYPQ